MYSTATPVVRETESDKEPSGELPEIVATAERMQEGYQKERVTVYSDDPLVGRVSGFISQETAIENSYLAKPSYEVRETVLQYSLKSFNKPSITPDGRVVDLDDNTAANPLSPKTYGALKSTLDSLVADPEPGVNSSHNVLAYVGSISQAEAYKEAFCDAAMAESGGINLEDAERKMNDSNPEVRRQARMRLLAEHADVKAAHSRTTSEAVKERKEAFAMFHGNAATSDEWSPSKRVLANVDIFSEGVSIPEIDTVVISDDDKFSEKSMTQAIGRAIRVVPGNSYKTHGHVIIPSVKTSDGVDLTASSVNIAAYTSTRVERGSTASKLRGERVAPDDHTTFKVYRAGGEVDSVKARSISQDAVTDLRDLAVAAEMSTNHTYLMANDQTYRRMSPSERFQARKSRIDEKMDSLKKAPEQKAYLMQVKEHLEGKSPREVQTMMKNSRVVGAALSTGDVSSLNSEVASLFIKSGVLSTSDSVAEITREEKVAYLKNHQQEFAYAILTTPPKMSDEHKAARDSLPEDLMKDKSMLGDNMKLLRGVGKETASTQRLSEAFLSKLEDEDFVNNAFDAVTRSDDQAPPILNAVSTKDVLRADRENLEAERFRRQQASAEQGEQSYVVDSGSVKKTGELRSLALRKLLGSDEF